MRRPIPSRTVPPWREICRGLRQLPLQHLQREGPIGSRTKDFQGRLWPRLDPEDKIEGMSGDIDLFNKKANFKVIYVTGQTPGTSFGTSSASGGSQGDTTGFVFKTDFFQQKLKTEMEYDISHFDQDTQIPSPREKRQGVQITLGRAGKQLYV